MRIFRIAGDEECFLRGDEEDHYYKQFGLFGVHTSQHERGASAQEVKMEEVPLYTKLLAGLARESDVEAALEFVPVEDTVKAMERACHYSIYNLFGLTGSFSQYEQKFGELSLPDFLQSVEKLAGEKIVCPEILLETFKLTKAGVDGIKNNPAWLHMVLTFNTVNSLEEDYGTL